MDINALRAYGASRRLIDTMALIGRRELYPSQDAAIEAGLLSKPAASFVMAAPTASGKTLVAEMAALEVFFRRAGKVLYLVPLRALAREKQEDFSNKYRPLGIKVMQSTGDFDSEEPWLRDADFIICTNEKLDSLIRHRARWLSEVSLLVADEVHLLGDPQRGPTLEVVMCRLRSMNPEMKFIALSATIPNASEIAGWLGAEMIESLWRPVPLREGVFYGGAAIFNDGSVIWIPRKSGSDSVDLALETIEQKGQALVFVGTRKATEAVASKALKYVSALLTEDDLDSLAGLHDEILAASAEPTRLCRKLAECARSGVAFHHAGIIYAHRKLVEDAFRANRIKLIASTTTLAMGLNLPSRRVIIRDWWRYASGLGMYSIPTLEIKQMSGRAGRPGYDLYGEAVMVAKNKRDEQHLFEKYIKGVPEKIDSQLASEPVLRTHILASIAGLHETTRDQLMGFLKTTFSAHQMGADYLAPVADRAMEFLTAEAMIAPDENRPFAFTATRFGRRVSELYLDPLSGVVIRDALMEPREKTPFSLFHMLSRTPDMMRLSLKKKDIGEMTEVFTAHAPSLLVPDEEIVLSERMLSELKTASVLMQWVLEMPEDRLVGHFGIGPGDLRNLVELADWLLYSAEELGRVFSLAEAAKAIKLLRIRVNYGVKEELLQLVSLRGIGRVRARNLYGAGFKNLRDIKGATAAELSKVPAVGVVIAEDIKKQTAQKRAEN